MASNKKVSGTNWPKRHEFRSLAWNQVTDNDNTPEPNMLVTRAGTIANLQQLYRNHQVEITERERNWKQIKGGYTSVNYQINSTATTAK